MYRYLVLGLSIVLAASACGPRKYSKGKYVDPGQVELLSDKFIETDLQKIAEEITASLLEDPLIANTTEPPVVMISLFTNGTDEHIDMLSLTNKIRAILAGSKKMRFVNEQARDILAEEYEYQESGFVDPALAKARGRQWGVDYLITGHISSIRQPVGRKEIVYYKTTMDLTELETNYLAWTDEVELKKTFRKRHVGR